MAKKRVLSFSPEEKRGVILHSEDGQTRAETIQDVSGIIKWAHEAREYRQDGDSALGTLVAVIPKTELDRAFIEGWYHDPKAWERWYADPVNELYRTSHYKSI